MYIITSIIRLNLIVLALLLFVPFHGLVGCRSPFAFRKIETSQPPHESKELIKPVMPELNHEKKSEQSPLMAGTIPKDSPSQKIFEERPGPPDEQPSLKPLLSPQPTTRPPTATESLQGKQASPSHEGLTQKPAFVNNKTSTRSSGHEPGGDRSLPAPEKSEPANASPSSDMAFKKHDHGKYLERIRNKAIDKVNREFQCVHATLCKDRHTDEWDLTLYYLAGKMYWFVAYSWDEVDQSWVLALESERQPISNWEAHHAFMSAGKECQILKRLRR